MFSADQFAPGGALHWLQEIRAENFALYAGMAAAIVWMAGALYSKSLWWPLTYAVDTLGLPSAMGAATGGWLGYLTGWPLAGAFGGYFAGDWLSRQSEWPCALAAAAGGAATVFFYHFAKESNILLGNFRYGFFVYTGAGLFALAGIFLDILRQKPQWEAQNDSAAARAFLEHLSGLMGLLAKSDGRVSEADISAAEQLFSELRLSGKARLRAIKFFREGAREGVDLPRSMRRFARHFPDRHAAHELVMALANYARRAGKLDDYQKEIIGDVASLLNLPRADVDRMLSLFSAQRRGWQQQSPHQQHRQQQQQRRQSYSGTEGGRTARPSSPPDFALFQACRILGVSADASEDEIKKAYRRLMSQNHPDKMMAQGMSADKIRRATEETKRIQDAYRFLESRRAEEE